MTTAIEINTYVAEYIDLMALRAKHYEKCLRDKVQDMKPLPEFNQGAFIYRGSSHPLYESRTEAQWIEDDAKDLHAHRGRLYQAAWQIERGDHQYCLCHAESRDDDGHGCEYELLLEPYGPYYDHWRVVLSGERGEKETSFSRYAEAQIWFFDELSELPRSR